MVIVSGVIVFLMISYFLVSVLYFAERKLVSQEDVQISINDDDGKSFKTKPGSTLLSSLSNQNIFIPSLKILIEKKILIKLLKF